jgi:hypothetical protein
LGADERLELCKQFSVPLIEYKTLADSISAYVEYGDSSLVSVGQNPTSQLYSAAAFIEMENEYVEFSLK